MSLWYLNILFEFQIILLPYIIKDISLLANLNLIPNVIQNKKKTKKQWSHEQYKKNNDNKIVPMILAPWWWLLMCVCFDTAGLCYSKDSSWFLFLLLLLFLIGYYDYLFIVILPIISKLSSQKIPLFIHSIFFIFLKMLWWQ